MHNYLSNKYSCRIESPMASTRLKRELKKDRLLNMDSLENENKEDLKFMSAKMQIQRYNKYLIKAFYIGVDPLIESKYQAYLRTLDQKKSMTVFERMEKDQQDRKMSEANPKSRHLSRQMSIRSRTSQSQMFDGETRSDFFP